MSRNLSGRGALAGAPDEFIPGFRQNVREDVARLGEHLKLGVKSDVLVSFIHSKRHDDVALDRPGDTQRCS